jgi:hypothetical protein
MEIAIFNVVAFAPTDDGKFRIVVHHVAGTNSEDAQRRILKNAAEHLPGRRFIGTDEGNALFRRLQSGSTTLDGASLSLTPEELNRWVDMHTKPNDSENVAGFREF